MPRLSVASWNINSVRFRLDLVRRFLAEEAPDVLCLQETKATDDVFPAEALAEAGYAHQLINGQPNYHGVAIVARVPLEPSSRHDWQDNGEARHVGAVLPGGVALECVYIPAGGDVPDRTVNPKFGQKLDFLERMARWSDAVDRPTILTGDFNVAPLPDDVWSHRQLVNTVSHTAVEIEALGRLTDSAGWVDLGRHFHPAPARLHSWWSYRAKDWRQSDRGRRLDHMWATPDLAPSALAHRVVEHARDWEKPSDHIPIITEFEW